MAEPIDAWWARRQWSKGVSVPYPVGTYRADWERYPVLIRQYHPEFNHGITLTQIPPVADVYLSWQCDVGHVFVATPEEQRNRPGGGQRRRSVWCPVCAQLANPPRIRLDGPPRIPERRGVRTSGERLGRPRNPDGRAAGDAFFSERAPRPSSAVEGELRQGIASRFDFDLGNNAIALSRPFFDRFEAWPDIVIPELRVAIEYDTTGRHGLEHVGAREKADRHKDRLVRAASWEVVRIRCGKLRPLGPWDLTASGLTGRVLTQLESTLGDIRGHLIVAAYRRA